MWDEKYADIKHMTTITTAKVEQMGTSICPGCCEETSQTGQLLHNTDLVFTVLETGKSKIKADAKSGEDQFWAHGGYLLIVGGVRSLSRML